MRLTIAQIGTLIIVVSLSFFFGAMIIAFGLRIEQQHAWQRFEFPRLLWRGTALLLVSSWTLEAGRERLRHALLAIYRGRLLATLALAFLFLAVQFVSARMLLQQGVAAEANPHGSVFYVFMGIHAAHLLGGIGWLGYLYYRSGRLYGGSETDLRQHRRALSAAAIYWHFMGLLWLALFFFLRRWTTE